MFVFTLFLIVFMILLVCLVPLKVFRLRMFIMSLPKRCSALVIRQIRRAQRAEPSAESSLSAETAPKLELQSTSKTIVKTKLNHDYSKNKTIVKTEAEPQQCNSVSTVFASSTPPTKERFSPVIPDIEETPVATARSAGARPVRRLQVNKRARKVIFQADLVEQWPISPEEGLESPV